MSSKRTLHILRPGSPEPHLGAGDVVFRVAGGAASQSANEGESPDAAAEALVKLVFEVDLVVTW